MDPVQPLIRPLDDFDYYTGQIYWNNFDAIVKLQNRLISGDEGKNWRLHTRDRYGVSDRALFVHSGNGWVERDCFRDGLIRAVVGTDVSESLLEESRREAEKIGLPAHYMFADTNTFDFGTVDFDWVFNHAAFHHIAYIDTAIRSMWKAMPVDGRLVAFDYTGPHRNQYPDEAWAAMSELNASIPAEWRPDLSYPHLPTMLATDPTEAVHSELILETCRRYFDILEITPLGGALAYQVLYGAKALYAAQHTPQAAALIARIIAADVEYTDHSPERSYFNYWVASPKPASAISDAQLEEWTRAENAREAQAQVNGGNYTVVNLDGRPSMAATSRVRALVNRLLGKASKR